MTDPVDSGEVRVLRQIEAGFSLYLEDILAAIRQRSISKTGEGIIEMAEWVASYLRELGAEVCMVSGIHAPIVEGVLGDEGSKKSLLLYELYDTQPATPMGWRVPPFEPAVTTLPGKGQAIVGRGAFNSKGPLVGFLSVLRAFRDADVELPVRLRFLIEGEEEIGSPSLEPYIREHQDVLGECDAAFIPYLGTGANGQTAIRLGFKGLMLVRLHVEGGEWGGPKDRDLHAMHSAWVKAPGWELLRALNSLSDEEGLLRVNGIDAWVHGPTRQDRRLLASLAEQITADELRDEVGTHRFVVDATAGELLERFMFSPTINIDRLTIGESGEGDPATILCRRASAYVDIRLVPKMSINETAEAVRNHLDQRGFSHVRMDIASAYPWSRTSPAEPAVDSLIRACRRHSANVQIWPMHAGAAPMYLFTDIVGIPFAFGGLGHGGNSHSIDEFILVEGLKDYYRSMVSFLFEFGKATEDHA